MIIDSVIIVAVIGIIAGIVLTLADKFMNVPLGEGVKKIRDILPGVNCGACGFAGCDEYAEKLAAGETKTNLCIPGADAVSHGISGVLGTPFEDVIEMRTIIRCSGSCEKTKHAIEYKGPQTCEACYAMYGGTGECSSACLGFGDCVSVCQYNAIYIYNGIAVVDTKNCTGCGMCETKCPKGIIKSVPQTSRVYVACSSTDTAANVRKACASGCIGCKRCEKVCPEDAIKVENNLAAVDILKCTNCESCKEACPVNAIYILEDVGVVTAEPIMIN